VILFYRILCLLDKMKNTLKILQGERENVSSSRQEEKRADLLWIGKNISPIDLKIVAASLIQSVDNRSLYMKSYLMML